MDEVPKGADTPRGPTDGMTMRPPRLASAATRKGTPRKACDAWSNSIDRERAEIRS